MRERGKASKRWPRYDSRPAQVVKRGKLKLVPSDEKVPLRDYLTQDYMPGVPWYVVESRNTTKKLDYLFRTEEIPVILIERVGAIIPLAKVGPKRYLIAIQLDATWHHKYTDWELDLGLSEAGLTVHEPWVREDKMTPETLTAETRRPILAAKALELGIEPTGLNVGQLKEAIASKLFANKEDNMTTKPAAVAPKSAPVAAAPKAAAPAPAAAPKAAAAPAPKAAAAPAPKAAAAPAPKAAAAAPAAAKAPAPTTAPKAAVPAAAKATAPAPAASSGLSEAQVRSIIVEMLAPLSDSIAKLNTDTQASFDFMARMEEWTKTQEARIDALAGGTAPATEEAAAPAEEEAPTELTVEMLMKYNFSQLADIADQLQLDRSDLKGTQVKVLRNRVLAAMGYDEAGNPVAAAEETTTAAEAEAWQPGVGDAVVVDVEGTAYEAKLVGLSADETKYVVEWSNGEQAEVEPGQVSQPAAELTRIRVEPLTLL